MTSDSGAPKRILSGVTLSSSNFKGQIEYLDRRARLWKQQLFDSTHPKGVCAWGGGPESAPVNTALFSKKPENTTLKPVRGRREGCESTWSYRLKPHTR